MYAIFYTLLSQLFAAFRDVAKQKQKVGIHCGLTSSSVHNTVLSRELFASSRLFELHVLQPRRTLEWHDRIGELPLQTILYRSTATLEPATREVKMSPVTLFQNRANEPDGDALPPSFEPERFHPGHEQWRISALIHQ